MSPEQQAAYNNIITATDLIKTIIVQAKSSTHKLELPIEAIFELSSAKETLFSVQREIESTLIK